MRTMLDWIWWLSSALPMSRIRIGTPSTTTQGMKEPEMAEIAELIARTLRGRDDDTVVEAVRADAAELCGRFTPYGG